jgi:hypothetical protein
VRHFLRRIGAAALAILPTTGATFFMARPRPWISFPRKGRTMPEAGTGGLNGRACIRGFIWAPRREGVNAFEATTELYENIRQGT